ncbi:MAG: DUF1854 domain-containing protein [Pirellulales bacterium]|jgi:hypothetical protein
MTHHDPPQPPAWRLERLPHGRVDFVSAAGVRHPDVDIVRAFPFTRPEGLVAIVADDGNELAWIERLDEVGPGLAAELRAELAAREFLPVITRIDAVNDAEPAEWTVQTDRGPRRFRVTGSDDVDRPADGSAVVTDTFGVRYRIPAIAALDPGSRRLFEKNL